MARKQVNLPKGQLFIALLVAAGVLLVLPQDVTKHLNYLFDRIFNSVLNMGRSTETTSFHPPETSTKNRVSLAQYTRIETAWLNTLADLKAVHHANEQLSKIRLEMPNAGPFVIANVKNTSIQGATHELSIDKGSINGLAVGQYVLGADTVIGTISETTHDQSTVRLITDAKHKIKTLLWKEKADDFIKCQLVGNGTEYSKIPLLPHEYKIKLNDPVYAADDVNFLAVPRVIGHVSEAKTDEKNPLLWDIKIKSKYDLNSFTKVAVIVMNPPKDLQKRNN